MRNDKLGLFTEEDMVSIQEEPENMLYGRFGQAVGKFLIGTGTVGLGASLGAIPAAF